VATDSAGNVYYSLGNGLEVYSTPGGPFATTPGTGLDGTGQLAVDGSGNVYVAGGNNSIQEFVGGAKTPITVVGGLNEPQGVAVDGAGNLYIGDTGNSRVLFQPAGGGTPTVLVSDHTFPMQSPAAIALDAAGNVYFVDIGSASIDEIPVGNGTPFRVAGGPSSGIQPTGIAVDAAGDILYTDMGLKEVIEIPVSGSNIVLASGFTTPAGVALDPSGNFYVADSSSTAGILAFTRSAAATHTLNFANSPMGTPSGDSPKTLTIGNIGNVTLNLPAPASGNNPSIATGFTLGSGAGSDCPLVPTGTAAGTMNPGTYCLLPVTFVPPSVASYNGSALTITDDALNASGPNYTTQTITLNGTGTGIPQTITFNDNLPANAIYNGVPLQYTLSATGGGSGNAVTFSLDGASTPGIATLVGSTLTITGVGTVTIDATQAASGSYSAGSNQQSITTFVDTPGGMSTISGNGQSVYQGSAFSAALVAQVTGWTSSLPMSGVTVIFAAPTSGPGATLSAYSAVTDVNGMVSVTGTANMTVGGPYDVTATTSGGIHSQAGFYITNVVPPTFTVTTLTDDNPNGNGTGNASLCNNTSTGNAPLGACSLRDAIAAATAVSTSTLNPIINFAATQSTSSGTITLSTSTPGDYNVTVGGTLNIGANMSIVGPNANLLSIDGGRAYQVFNIGGGTVSISGLTITNGSTTSNGGGIGNESTLTVANCTISNNSTNSPGSGGGIADNVGAKLTVTNSTFNGNYGFNGGGGIYNYGGALTVTNSTFTQNTGSVGGAIYNTFHGTLTMTNSTISGNTAPFYGPGIQNAGSSAVLENMLVPDVLNGVYSGNNIVSSGSIDLAPLGYYGGTTQTMPPLPDSVAICAGYPDSATGAGLTTDQRGNPRSTLNYGSTPCVDAGAVQTAYSLIFTSTPSSKQIINTVFTPTPAVQLTDNGLAIALPGASIGMRLSNASLSGSTSQTTGATGVASFSNLSASTAETGGYLTASITTTQGSTVSESSNFDVDLLPQTITIIQALPAGVMYNGVMLPYTTSATGGNSVSPVIFTIDGSSTPNIANINPNTGALTIFGGPGTVIVDANQAGSGNYAAATQVQQTILVTLDTPVGTVGQPFVTPSAYVGQTFANPVAALVIDANNNPVWGVTVTFTAPANGASAILSSPTGPTGTVTTAVSDVNGYATITVTANSMAGSYNIVANFPGSQWGSAWRTINLPPPAFTVTTLTDDNPNENGTGNASYCNDTSTGNAPISGCSLRDAIAAAAAVSTSTLTPTINFASSLNLTTAAPGDYNVTTGGTLSIGANMNIVGPGANLLSIDGANSSGVATTQIFYIGSGTVSISGLTITKGNTGTYGGGIVNYGTLTVSNSTFSGNSSGGYGGGIANMGSGPLAVSNSTFNGNYATYGGGIANMGSGPLAVSNSTFNGNSANVAGGGIADMGSGTLTVSNSTFSGNSDGIYTVASNVASVSDSTFSGNTWGIYNESTSPLKLANNLINDSLTDSWTGFGSATHIDNGGNVIAGLTSGVTSGSISLAPLSNYGGATQTMPPLPGSAAICAGTVANATAAGLTTDQRGNPRSTTAYSTTACVDAGAVQTAYSLQFTTSPSSTQKTNTPFTPAPVVQLYDLNPATGNPAPIALSGAQIVLALGTGSFTTGPSIRNVYTGSTGAATFNSLTVSTAESNDLLGATSPVGPWAIAANSSTFNIIAITLSPAAGTLSAATYGAAYNQQFTANGGTAPYSYTATSLPTGLSINSATGLLAGTPTSITGSPYSIVVTVTDAVSNTIHQSYTLAVGPAASAISVSPSVNPAFINNTVTYTAAVGFATAPSLITVPGPTGTVTFSDGGTPITACTGVTLGAYSSTTGAALATCPVSYTSTTPVTHSITATYTPGNTNFTGSSSSSTLTETLADFTITAQNATLTIIPGTSGQYKIIVSPVSPATTFPTAINLTVSGLSSGVTYSFSPSATIAAGTGATTVTLTIQTDASAQNSPGWGGSLTSKLAPFSMALLLLPFVGRLHKAGKRFSRMLSILLLLAAGAAAVAGLSGCGSTIGFFGQPQKSYTVGVTATSGMLSHTSNVTLTVE
jgi:CSLREA domain-containing protein